jgi:hypothetical protein
MSCTQKKEDAVQITVESTRGQVNTESVSLPGWRPKVVPIDTRLRRRAEPYGTRALPGR